MKEREHHRQSRVDLGFRVLESGPGDRLVVRGFNPSELKKVDRIKALASALVNEISEAYCSRGWLETGHRDSVVRAMNYAELASMMGVKAWVAYPSGTEDFLGEKPEKGS